MSAESKALAVKNLSVGVAVLAATAAIVFIGFQVVRTGKKILEVAPDALNKINPLNNDNIFSQFASGVTQAVSGDEDATLGTKIFDVVQSVKGFFSSDPAPAPENFGDGLPPPVDFT